MAYKYCTANNWGKNFFTHEERRSFELSGQPGNIWVVGDNAAGDAWISKVSGVVKTKAEAQAIIDAEISAAQAEWDALSEEQKQNLPNRHIRPQAIILP